MHSFQSAYTFGCHGRDDASAVIGRQIESLGGWGSQLVNYGFGRYKEGFTGHYAFSNMHCNLLARAKEQPKLL